MRLRLHFPPTPLPANSGLPISSTNASPSADMILGGSFSAGSHVPSPPRNCGARMEIPPRAVSQPRKPGTSISTPWISICALNNQLEGAAPSNLLNTEKPDFDRHIGHIVVAHRSQPFRDAALRQSTAAAHWAVGTLWGICRILPWVEIGTEVNPCQGSLARRIPFCAPF
jgi:hypothetical protein